MPIYSPSGLVIHKYFRCIATAEPARPSAVPGGKAVPPISAKSCRMALRAFFSLAPLAFLPDLAYHSI